jgi:rhodanese-related sulfurtransferase
MSRKKRSGATSRLKKQASAEAAHSVPGLPTDRRARIGLVLVALILASVVVIGADFVIGTIANGGSAAAGETVVQGQGGHWTNVTPDRLAEMLGHKDFTLVNVVTPYSSEIEPTDLYIPYAQLAQNVGMLPPDKTAKILVYCRSGVESAQAAQTLLDLGYTNVWNLDGCMNAWTASGRALVTKKR